MEQKHAGPLTEAEKADGLFKCAPCGFVQYTTSKAAETHQAHCRSVPRAKQDERASTIRHGKTTANKWKPHARTISAMGTAASANIDLTDRLSRRVIDDFFKDKPIDTLQFFVMACKTIQDIPGAAQHGRAILSRANGGQESARGQPWPASTMPVRLFVALTPKARLPTAVQRAPGQRSIEIDADTPALHASTGRRLPRLPARDSRSQCHTDASAAEPRYHRCSPGAQSDAMCGEELHHGLFPATRGTAERLQELYPE